MLMLNDKTIGIKVQSRKTFYYIETGDNWIGNPVDRLRKTLVQRNIIHTKYDGTSTPHEMCTYLQLKNNNTDYIVKPIFLSKHIQELYEAKNADEDLSTGLFKS